jgi:hypothetical protein
MSEVAGSQVFVVLHPAGYRLLVIHALRYCHV